MGHRTSKDRLREAGPGQLKVTKPREILLLQVLPEGAKREAGAKLILEVHRSRKRDEGQSWDMEFHLHIKGGKNLPKSGQTLEEGPEDPQSVVSPSLCVLGRQTPAGAQSWGPARPEAKAPKWSSVTLPT